MSLFQTVDTKIQKFLFLFDPFIKLLPRLIIGAVFIPAGWGKIQNLSKTIGFFSSIDIPLSSVLAPMVAFSEVVFGVFILVGFYTRVSVLPLLMIMIVALGTAHRAEIASLYSLTEMPQALYATLLICIFGLGSGTFSLDQLFYRRR